MRKKAAVATHARVGAIEHWGLGEVVDIGEPVPVLDPTHVSFSGPLGKRLIRIGVMYRLRPLISTFPQFCLVGPNKVPMKGEE